MRIERIGTIRTPFKSKADTPVLSCESTAVCRVELREEFEDGLTDIEGFSHVFLIFRFHRAKGHRLKVPPLLGGPARGVFATRYPARPNRIGVTVARLLRRRGRVLYVRGLDVIDGTPLLDIKPFAPDAMPQGPVRFGWLRSRLPARFRMTSRPRVTPCPPSAKTA